VNLPFALWSPLLPELPEVESVRHSLLPHLIGRQVARVIIGRTDIVTPPAAESHLPAHMLQGQVLQRLDRIGKQLLLHAASGQAIGIHLGMTGQCTVLRPGEQPERSDHIHMRWQLVDPARPAESSAELLFRDPRRFGELRWFACPEAVATFAARLGPDALAITGQDLFERAHSSRRAIKAVLLDQAVLAGVGNIYADEALHASHIRPRRAATRVTRAEYESLAAAIRAVLTSAVTAGGSTLRDYLDADGNRGSFAAAHRVYGRGGQPCLTCSATLKQCQVAQRTTVFCTNCQR